MLNVKAYSNYFGGKNSNGTYQTIINYIPPHDIFYSLYLGNCAVARHIRPANLNILNDLDTSVYEAWKTLPLPLNYELHNNDALYMLKDIQLSENTPKGIKFIYLDPPYRLIARRTQVPVYKHEMSDQDHIDLLSQIIAMKDLIMISHYPDTMYDEMLAGWQTHDFYSTIRNGVALERIYYNYNLTDKRHDYSFLGEDFREREANGRLKKNFLKKLNSFPPELKNSILQAIMSSH